MTGSPDPRSVAVIDPLPDEALAPPPPPPLHWPGPSPARAAYAPPSGSRLAVGRIAAVVTAISVLAALLLAYEFWFSSIPAARAQAELLAAFQEAVPTTTLDSPASTPVEGAPIALLSIPRLNLNSEVVVEGSSASDLKMGPGHLSASPLPGEYGNAVILGRRTTYGSPFGGIGSLHKGDTIKVATGQGAVTYKVSKVERIGPGKQDVVGDTKDSRLTLVTSDPALVPTGRLAVVATLKGKPLAVPTRPAALEDIGQLGLTGDFGGLVLGLVFLELLTGAVILTWLLRRRVPRAVLYLFAAPVMTTLVVLTFANLDSLLPGTM